MKDLLARWKDWCWSTYSDRARQSGNYSSAKIYEIRPKQPEVLNKLPSLYNQPEFVDKVSKEEALEGFKSVLRAIGETHES